MKYWKNGKAGNMKSIGTLGACLLEYFDLLDRHLILKSMPRQMNEAQSYPQARHSSVIQLPSNQWLWRSMHVDIFWSKMALGVACSRLQEEQVGRKGVVWPSVYDHKPYICSECRSSSAEAYANHKFGVFVIFPMFCKMWLYARCENTLITATSSLTLTPRPYTIPEERYC